MDNIFVGIDPGIKGGVAFVDKRRKILALEESPPEELIAKKINSVLATLANIRSIHFAIEDVFVRAHESRVANKTIVRNMGIWLGVCYNIVATRHGPSDTLENPSPNEWQRIYTGMQSWRYWVETNIAQYTHQRRKAQRACQIAKEIFADEDLEPRVKGPRGGIKDGLCDALLIANWRREKYLLEQKKI